MKNFLDPIANAKTLGFLFMLVGVVEVLSDITNPLVLLNGIIKIVVGFGLRTVKIWALYMLGVATLINVIEVAYYYLNPNDWEVTSGDMLGLTINILVFLWFFSARSRFASAK